ncbi:MAG: hypothetical protein ABSD74_20010 [Rhizomicrobium sp.]|jgi:hypothetical protein
MFTPWLPNSINAGQWLGRCDLLNSPEIRQALPAPGEFARNGVPVARMTFADESYDRDCFQIGPLTFVSEKLRRAMALGPADVQYFDVDADRSQSAPLPLSKHYQLMHVPVAEDVSDPEHSEYLFRQRPDGFEVLTPPYTIAFHPGAEPAHDIFYDRFFKVILCTDELALRVLWAGCTGLRFVDPARLRGGLGPYRTLRGVEEDDVWDPVRKINAVKLIREIP